jgi:membrane protein YqaA with SNARE-associated domain
MLTQNGELDKSQNRRIEALEKQSILLTTEITAISTKIETLTNIGKVLCIVAGAALGVDVLPMLA